MPFTPEAIFKDFKNNDLDKSSAVDLLISLVDSVETVKTRLDSINIIQKINYKDKKIFNFLENLLIADSNEEVRCQAAKVFLF